MSYGRINALIEPAKRTKKPPSLAADGYVKGNKKGRSQERP
jgi:hypothetical protein